MGTFREFLNGQSEEFEDEELMVITSHEQFHGTMQYKVVRFDEPDKSEMFTSAQAVGERVGLERQGKVSG